MLAHSLEEEAWAPRRLLRGAAEDGVPAELQLGELFLLQSIAQVRAEPSLSSSLLAELPRGTPLRLLELGRLAPDGSAGQLRAKMAATARQKEALVGWISATTSSGRLLLSRVSFGMAPVDLPSAVGVRCTARARALVRQPEEVSEQSRRETAFERLGKLVQGFATPEEFSDAIQAARKAGVAEEELEKAERQLQRSQELEEIAAAREQLQDAITRASCPTLRGAIGRAEAAGLPRAEIARAQVVLDRELCKQALRDALRALPAETEDLSPEQLGEMNRLIHKARDAWLEDCVEYRNMVLAVRKTAEKSNRELQAVKEALQVAMDATAGMTSRSGAEALQEAKEKLNVAVRAARDAGLAEQELAQAENRRRRIHNAVEDLKGSIRVFCRIRPMSAREQDAGDIGIVSRFDDMSLTVQLTRADVERANKDWAQFGRPYNPEAFSFDAVFVPGTQEEIFEDCKDLIRSALDGYNVTIFAYGQTGAGKTHTMFGKPKEEGVGPRTISELFRLMDQDSERFDHCVEGSMAELYRNEIIDLLPNGNGGGGHGEEASRTSLDAPGSARRSSRWSMSSQASAQGDGRSRRSGVGLPVDLLLEKHECSTAEQLLELLHKGAKQRHVSATAMNKESSRSHLILTIHVVRTNKETQDRSSSKISICDLAGSERLKKSHAGGEIAKEGIEINKSLTALGDVFAALTEGHSHVPYNNSKLTQVLKDALGGTSKTLMFVNCSPSGSNIEETRNTLHYARRAKKVINQHAAK